MKNYLLIFSIIVSEFTLAIPYAFSFELIAHRGIYQNYDREDIDSITCTADKIFSPQHNFIENTVSSIEKAFNLGADMVEIDIHPTTESKVADERLVVFHDWELTCKTNANCQSGCRCDEKGQCITDQQSWNYLNSLDIAFGYTVDGKSFPFRGTNVGMMPTFKQAVSLLIKYPAKKLLVNVKDKYSKTQDLLLKELAEFSADIRSRVYVEFQKVYTEKFQKLSVPEAIWQTSGVKQCFIDLIQLGNKNEFPYSCRNKKYFIPLHQDMGAYDPKLKGTRFVALIPGWPDGFLKQASTYGAEIYLSQVNNEVDLKFSKSHDFKGIMTDKIEFISPTFYRK